MTLCCIRMGLEPDNNSSPASPNRLIVGWKEEVGLPDLGVRKLVAKTDTGADVSAIHVENLRHETGPDGDEAVFDVVLSRKNPAKRVAVRHPITRTAVVRSSNGQSQERIVITTTLRLGNERFPIELNLVSRPRMRYRMLLGRRALEGRALVDTELVFNLGRKPRKGSAGAASTKESTA